MQSSIHTRTALESHPTTTILMRWRSTLQTWKPVGAACRDTGRQIGATGLRWLGSCVELLFPNICLLCGRPQATGTDRICHGCQKGIGVHDVTRCPRCAKPLPQYSKADTEGCPLCRSKRLRFQRAIALGTYGGEVRELILRIKQPRHEALCLAAGELLAGRIECELQGSLPDLVVPVPMHWLRKLLRGTNDSEVLVEAVAGQLHRPVSMRMLRCLRPTRKQGTLLPTERRLNVRGAYEVRRRAKIAGAHVLIVDDVMTTGATANELAKVLHRAGAAQVTVAVVARGVGFD